MSIHTRLGGDVPVNIVANAGLHKPRYFRYAAQLVQVEYADNNSRRWQWLEFLRAEGGYPEILEAAKAAPVVTLSKRELQAAFVQAE